MRVVPRYSLPSPQSAGAARASEVPWRPVGLELTRALANMRSFLSRLRCSSSRAFSNLICRSAFTRCVVREI